MHGDVAAAPHDGGPSGGGDYHAPRLARRTAAEAAAFFLPHLRPGMRVLDAGCGPGTITLGLAEAVRHGEVVGIDPDAGRLAHARTAAAERDVANVRFEEGDILSLPFEDGSFDAALIHAVLEHLPDPVAALREVRRVLKPGGVVGARDSEHTAMLVAPPDPLGEEGIALMFRAREHLGVHNRLGRSLRGLLRAAGFARVAGSASVEAYGTPEGIRQVVADMTGLLSNSRWSREALAQGWADVARIAEYVAAWRAWGEHPDAFWSSTWCEAVGWAD